MIGVMVAPHDAPPPEDDPMGPPRMPVEVYCIHCGNVYMSDRIQWQPDSESFDGGTWVCPIDGCDGAGFCFDIYPTDPDIARQFGVEYFDEEEDEEGFVDDFSVPDPPTNSPRTPRIFGDDEIPF